MFVCGQRCVAHEPQGLDGKRRGCRLPPDRRWARDPRRLPASHSGYQATPKVHAACSPDPRRLPASPSGYLATCWHLVLSTWNRHGVFTRETGQTVYESWKRHSGGCACERCPSCRTTSHVELNMNCAASRSRRETDRETRTPTREVSVRFEHRSFRQSQSRRTTPVAPASATACGRRKVVAPRKLKSPCAETLHDFRRPVGGPRIATITSSTHVWMLSKHASIVLSLSRETGLPPDISKRLRYTPTRM